MSKLVALYVYAPTEFVTNSKVVTLAGVAVAPDAAHRFTLPRGIYRHDENAKLEPVTPIKPPSFDAKVHIKGDAPDPPPRAQKAFAESIPSLDPFLNGAGTEPVTL